MGVFSLIRETDDQEVAALDNLILEMTKFGAQSAEFRNRQKSAAFEFSFTVCCNPRGMDFAFSPSFEGRNAKEIYDVLKFELALSKPGTLTVVNRVIDLTLLSGHTGAHGVSDYVRVGEQLFSKLVTIQKKTNIRLNFVRDLTEIDVQQLEIVHAVAGHYYGTGFSFPTAEVNPDIKLPIGEPVDLRFEGRESAIFQILDANFDLGPAEIIATNCMLSSETTDAGEHRLLVKPDPGTIPVNFHTGKGREESAVFDTLELRRWLRSFG